MAPRMLAALCAAILVSQLVEGQPAQAPSAIIGRISEAPARSVSANLQIVPAGTTYYTDNIQQYQFEGEGPPEDWCKNSKDPKCVCQTGRRQSPIDLGPEILKANGITADLLERAYPQVLTPNYSTAAIVNVSAPGSGTPQINVAPGSPPSYISFNNRTFELVQIHFHAGAEHTFNGSRPDLEAHIVHKDPATNGLAVFGFNFEAIARQPDPLLQLALDNKPNATYTDGNGKQKWNATRVWYPVNLQELLSPYYQGHFALYTGSLTTPPCTEGVQWFYFPRVLPFTIGQLADFEEFKGEQFPENETIPHNYRPTQPLNGRTVELY